MPSSAAVFAGVDPSSGREAYTHAVLDDELRIVLLAEGDLEEVVRWLTSVAVATVAINSPSGVNRGLVRELLKRGSDGSHQIRGAEMRLAEHELRAVGLAVAGTPSRADICPAWVRAGLQLYEELARLGFFQTTDLSVDRRLFETQPEACFRAILGRNALPRSTLEGRLQRQAALHERGVRVTDPMAFLEEITRYRLLQGALPMDLLASAAQLDALAAAYTAWLAAHHPESIRMIGDPEEGQILLPGPITANA